MIRYHSGEEARLGDRVDLDGTPGVVRAIIATEAEQAQWDIDEPSLMIETAKYGWIYQPISLPDWPPVILMARAEPS